MAQDTSKSLRNQVIYSIFVRNYSQEGTFEAVRRDLPRIRSLGVDIIWLMPIHPVGNVHRKGTLGSPYAVADYRGINPEFGTMEDFRRLVDDIHALGMKCIIDVVYHHTSPDSWLAQHHPEWFFHKADGSLGNQVGDWWDVVDLDYTHRELWDYLIETLCQWAAIVDGFRCDVASMVPVEFWKTARHAVAQIRPGAIWLAESVEPEFIRFNRQQGIYCASDSEIYQAFDIAYDYDIYDDFEAYLQGKISLAAYAADLNAQETMYPDNYVKLRCLENHDRLRAHFLIPDTQQLLAWTAFLYFQKGTTLLYAGQESSVCHTPSLFDKDTIDWSRNTIDQQRDTADWDKDTIDQQRDTVDRDKDTIDQDTDPVDRGKDKVAHNRDIINQGSSERKEQSREIQDVGNLTSSASTSFAAEPYPDLTSSALAAPAAEPCPDLTSSALAAPAAEPCPDLTSSAPAAPATEPCPDLSPLLRRLYAIKKDPLFADSTYEVRALPHDVLIAVHTRNGHQTTPVSPAEAPASDIVSDEIPSNNIISNDIASDNIASDQNGTVSPDTSPRTGGTDTTDAPGSLRAEDHHTKALGLFPLRGGPSVADVSGILPDGIYHDAVTGRAIEISMGRIRINQTPVILLN